MSERNAAQEALFEPAPAPIANLREGLFRVNKGHIVSGDLTFMDLGPVLRSWCAGEDLDVTPTRARLIGEALIAWADHKSGAAQGGSDA